MPHFPADPRGARFSEILRESSLGVPFDTALFSPIDRTAFNAGTVYVSTAAGIDTLPTPQGLHGTFDFEPTSRRAFIPRVSGNVNLSIHSVGDDLRHLGLLHPFPATTSGRLYCYTTTGETALLFHGAPCHHYKLNWTPASVAFWEAIKLHYSRTGGSFENVSVVTEAYTSNRWALDYRSAADYPNAPSYAVNAVNAVDDGNIATEELPGDFHLRHTSDSLKLPPLPDTWVEYTILECHTSASRVRLNNPFKWAVHVFSRAAAQIKRILLPTPSKTSNFGYSSNPYNSTTTASQGVVNKLYLGGTFFLIECCNEYYFESEGHRDGFQLFNFMQSLLYYCQSLGNTDWEAALEIVFPIHGNFPVALPSEYDFRPPFRPLATAVGYGGLGYSEKPSYGTSVANWETNGLFMPSY